MENKIRYQPIVLFLASLAVTAVAGALTAKLDDDSVSFIVFKIGKPLMLTCKPDDAKQTKDIIWAKMIKIDDKKDFKEVNVEKVDSLKGRHSVKEREGNFIIERTTEDDAGNYTCTLGGEKQTINVVASVIVKIPENIYVVEEEKLEITCIVKGTDPIISWEYRDENVNESTPIDTEDERFHLTDVDDVENARLTIEKAETKDRGFYSCIGYNEYMKDNKAKSEGFVRVKDKLAALWPFIGICAEVFVLCAIILIYENRRNKESDNDSDTDQGDQKK